MGSDVAAAVRPPARRGRPCRRRLKEKGMPLESSRGENETTVRVPRPPLPREQGEKRRGSAGSPARCRRRYLKKKQKNGFREASRAAAGSAPKTTCKIFIGGQLSVHAAERGGGARTSGGRRSDVSRNDVSLCHDYVGSRRRNRSVSTATESSKKTKCRPDGQELVVHGTRRLCFFLDDRGQPRK